MATLLLPARPRCRDFETVEITGKRAADLPVPHSIGDGGFEVTQLAAAVVARAFKFVGENCFVAQQRSDAIGELNLLAHACLDFLQMVEDSRRQDIPAHHAQRRRRHLGFRFLDDSGKLMQALATLNTPMMEASRFSYCVTICCMTDMLASMRSSARMTANGSSPTRWRAHSTACPRPSASAWRT